MAKSRLHELSELGQSVWIDFLSRKLLQSGKLAQMMEEDAVVGVTSNPTIFQKAIAEGDAYDEQFREVLAEEEDPKEVFLRLAVQDVQNGCDLLRAVWDGGGGQDGYVSIEVDPNLAYDTQGTIDEAQRLHELVDRPNCFVKIPATEPGLPAIEEMIARGRSINVTLIFSLQRYAEVVEAYLRGLERLVESGGDPGPVASVASFFVSRVDTETDRRLAETNREDLKGRLGIANAKLAYQQYKALFRGQRWDALAARGATVQRCLWASTSVKDPSLRDTLYVEELIGPETISTMPEKTIRAFQDHGRVELRLESDLEEAQYLFNKLYAVGVDYDDVVATLEREGIEKFVASVDRLLEQIRAKRRDIGAGGKSQAGAVSLP
jgi:transaldolase